MLRYVIVGSGYRAEYFGRIARTYPDLFGAMFLCRSREKAGLMTARTGAPAVTDEDECLAFRPDFAVIAVDRGHMAEVIARWAEKGLPLVTETPVGETMDQLRAVWALGAGGAKIVSCEQYFRQPILLSGLAAVEEGLIGTPSSLYISLLHDYHAASVIRRALQVPVGEAFTVTGAARQNTVIRTDSRTGAILDGSRAAAERMTALISFDSGKSAVYDFSPVQYRSFIRSRHLVVRGDRGEWSDTSVSFADGAGVPRKLFLTPEIPEKYRCLDTQALRDRRRGWQHELMPDTVQDEFAIASMLLDMGGYLTGGPSPYPLKDALEDAYFWCLLKQAALSPFRPIRSERMPWHP